MSLITTNEPLTTEVYLAGRQPTLEYGVVIWRGQVELAREEEFWSEASARRAAPRIAAEAARKVAA